MKTKLCIITVAALLNALIVNKIDLATAGESQLFIYGTVEMENGDKYTGQIRWGKEEIYWFDYFNSSKPKNEYLDYLSEKQLDELNEDCQYSYKNSLLGSVNMSWGNCDNTHLFSTQFGDIKKIEVRSKNKVTVTLKNGDSIKLKGGSNDIGTKIQIHDKEIGLIKLDWKNIEFVEFSNTPSVIENYFGKPLYGTANTEEGSFTGFLQWDHDERVTNDELNGEYEDGDLDIKFGKIKSIKKVWGGSEVTLHSGRTFKLDGTNDVDGNNRGIIVNIPGQGRVDIDWDEFEEIVFTDVPDIKDLAYSDFIGDAKLEGSVKTQAGTVLDGTIVYDLDEAYGMEILNGVADDIKYFIPFADIKNITKNGRRNTTVTTRNGWSVDLDDNVDVDENNDGLLVFQSKNDDPIYVPWQDVDSIDFN